MDAALRYVEDEDVTGVWWEGLNPVPSEATTLTFTITRIGDLEGPWVFEISLQD